MTTPRWNRRLIAGAGPGALAATTMAGLTLGAGDAHAAPITADGSVRVYNYTLLPNSQQWVDPARTVSESSVDQGETVTITTAISVHSNGPGWSVTLETLEDWTPAKARHGG